MIVDQVGQNSLHPVGGTVCRDLGDVVLLQSVRGADLEIKVSFSSQLTFSALCLWLKT